VDCSNLAGDRNTGGFCKHSDEIAGSLKVGSFDDQLSDCKRFNNDCSVRSLST